MKRQKPKARTTDQQQALQDIAGLFHSKTLAEHVMDNIVLYTQNDIAMMILIDDEWGLRLSPLSEEGVHACKMHDMERTHVILFEGRHAQAKRITIEGLRDLLSNDRRFASYMYRALSTSKSSGVKP